MRKATCLSPRACRPPISRPQAAARVSRDGMRGAMSPQHRPSPTPSRVPHPAGRTGFLGGEWREMAATVGAYFDSQRLASSARPPRPRLRRGAVAAEAAAEAAAATIVDFREVTVQYATNKAPPDLGLDESVISAVG